MALRLLADHCISNTIVHREGSRNRRYSALFERRLRRHRDLPAKELQGIIALQMRNRPETLPHLMERLEAHFKLQALS